MSKFHINKHGVPAPCKAKPGNCPLGGDETHFNSQEEAQVAIDKQNEAKYGHLPGIVSSEDKEANLTDKEIINIGKKLTRLIDKRKNRVPEPDLPNGKNTIRSIDDLETLVETRGEYITSQEHDPVKNVQSMFDHVAGNAGKLYRYDDKENPYLETHEYPFYGTMRRHEEFLEGDNYFNPDYYGDEDETKADLRNKYKADLQKHEQLYKYTEDLAVEYGKDFEKKVVLSGKYNLDEQNKIQGEYRKALADKVGKFVQNYGD